MSTSLEQVVEREPSKPRSTTGWKRRWLLLALAIPFVVTALIVFPPSKYPIYLPCPMYAWTGYHCAGCGSTRAVRALVVGDFYQALAYNPLFVVCLPVLVVFVIRRAVAKSQGDKRPFVTIPNWLVWPAVGLVIVYTILRNIPTPMFVWLAPHSLS